MQDDLLQYELLTRYLGHPGFIWMNYGLDGDDFQWMHAEDGPWMFQVNMARHNVRHVDLSGVRFLDTGCGRGGNCWFLKRYYQPNEIVGLDQSQAQIEWCRRRFAGSGIQFVAGNAEQLPFEDARFDVISNIESACHYQHRRRFFREVARVLRPNGTFCHSCNYDSPAVAEREMSACGLTVVEGTDITSRVVTALRKNDVPLRDMLGEFAVDSNQKQIAQRLCDGLLFIADNLAAFTPYYSWVLRKTAPHASYAR